MQCVIGLTLKYNDVCVLLCKIIHYIHNDNGCWSSCVFMLLYVCSCCCLCVHAVVCVFMLWYVGACCCTYVHAVVCVFMLLYVCSYYTIIATMFIFNYILSYSWTHIHTHIRTHAHVYFDLILYFFRYSSHICVDFLVMVETVKNERLLHVNEH